MHTHPERGDAECINWPTNSAQQLIRRGCDAAHGRCELFLEPARRVKCIKRRGRFASGGVGGFDLVDAGRDEVEQRAEVGGHSVWYLAGLSVVDEWQEAGEGIEGAPVLLSHSLSIRPDPGPEKEYMGTGRIWWRSAKAYQSR